ncbi:hypothetical protein Taro_015150, partial [Colocasia esculenta]|nr:hypothetical protein [Colocasia esculenta]
TTRRRPRSSSSLAGRRRRSRSPVSIRCARPLHRRDSITPWAQSTKSTGESTRSTGDPIIANERSAMSVSSRKIQWSAGDGAEMSVRTRKAPIQNWHFDPELPRLRESLAEPTRRAAQSQRSEVVFNSTQDLLPRSWIWVPEHRRYSHPLRFILTPSAKELCITFRTGIGIAYVITFRNRHSETVDRALVSRNSVPGPKFPSGALATPSITRIAGGAHTRSRLVTAIGIHVQLNARSPPQWIWVPEHRRYSHPLRFIPTPSAKELGITFRTGIGIAYVTTIRNRHSEMVDRALVSRNSVSGPKFPPEHV